MPTATATLDPTRLSLDELLVADPTVTLEEAAAALGVELPGDREDVRADAPGGAHQKPTTRSGNHHLSVQSG